MYVFSKCISNSEGSSAVVKIKMLHVIVSFSIKPFGKHFLHNKKTSYSWRTTLSILGGNPFLTQGGIIRTIYEAQHRRLPACSRKHWELFMKNNIECFLCDVPNIWIFLLRVFPLLTLFIIRRVAKSTSTLLNSKYFNIYTKKLIIETS